mgnify:CR=1 FL=1
MRRECVELFALRSRVLLAPVALEAPSAGYLLDWATLDEATRDAVLRRPVQRDAAGLLERARSIVADVRVRGDEALREYTARFDDVHLQSFAVSDAEFAAAEAVLTPVQRAALERAIDTITRFHELQTLPPLRLETAPGVVCERMTVALESVGLKGWETHGPSELSGGQQQRVAIARALVTDPAILLADEPTGNLDSRTSREIMELLGALNRDKGITILMVTHEPDMAAYAKRIIRFVDGRVESDVRNAHAQALEPPERGQLRASLAQSAPNGGRD